MTKRTAYICMLVLVLCAMPGCKDRSVGAQNNNTNTSVVTVTLDEERTPPATNTPGIVPGFEFAVFSFTGPIDADMELTSLAVTREGSGSMGDFTDLGVYEYYGNGAAHSMVDETTPDRTERIDHPGLFQFFDGETLYISVQADVNAEGYSQNLFCINEPGDVEVIDLNTNLPMEIEGDFPICGNMMTATTVVVGTITYTVSYPSSADINVGDTDVTLIRIRLDNNNVEDAIINPLAFEFLSIPWDIYIANPTLLVSGTPLDISAMGTFNTPNLQFWIDPYYYLEKGNSVSFELRGDVQGGVCRGLNMDFNLQMTNAIGATYAFPMDWQEGANSQVPFDRNIIGNAMFLEASSNNPIYQDVSAGTSDHLMLEFYLESSVDNTTVWEIEYEIEASGNNPWEYIQDVTVWTPNANGEWVSLGSRDLMQQDCSFQTCSFTLTDTVDIEQCDGNLFHVTADIGANAPVGTGISVNVVGSSIVATDQSNQPIPPPINTLDGNSHSIIAAP